jgi:1-acyl-sn-glycerol-3-phosphate acyltransferase
LLGRFFRFELVGVEHLPTGRYIVAANHPGWLEAFGLIAFLPAERGLRAIAKRDVTTAIPWRRWLIEQADAVLAIDPRQGDVEDAIRLAVRQLRGGAAVCIFPEPPHTPMDSYEHLLRLRRGVAFLARVGESPVVPVGVADTRELWLGRRIRINVGAPLPPPRSHAEEAQFLCELAQQIERLRPPADPLPDRPHCRWLSRLF